MDNRRHSESPLSGVSHPPLTKIERVGRGMWLMLHMLAERYKDSPMIFLDILTDSVEKVLPCPICKGDARDYIHKNPITPKTFPPLWICTFHNRVNLNLRKQVFPCEPCIPPAGNKESLSTATPRQRSAKENSDGFVDAGYYLD